MWMAKEAWDIVQTMFEGSGDVKWNKFLSLTTRFENLKMHEDETLSDFCTKLCDIANESFALNFLKLHLSEKLWDLFQIGLVQGHCYRGSQRPWLHEGWRFNRIPSCLWDALKKRKRKKSIALNTVHEEEDSNEENNDDELALLTKNFKKFLRKWASHLNLALHFQIHSRIKILLKPLIFLTIRRGFNIPNVKAMDIFNPSVQTLIKRSPRPWSQPGVMRNQMRVRKTTTW